MKTVLKSDQFFEATSSFVTSIVLIILGILILIGKNQLYFSVIDLFISSLLILGVLQFIRYLFLTLKPQEKKVTFARSFFYLLFCLILSSFPSIPRSILSLLFSIYMLLNGGIKLITYLILLSSRSNGRLGQLILALIYFAVGIPLLISPIQKVDTMLIFLGWYTILLGVTYFLDFLSEIIPKRYKTKLRRHFRITLPVLLEAILPYQVLREINYYLNKEAFDIPMVYEEKKSEIIPDLEVFIHVAPSGYNRFGHVDVCMNGLVLSYGAYDFSTSKLFNMIGEGMVFQVDREKYIDYCTHYSNKTLFCFGMKLTDRQKNNVEKQINAIMENVNYYETNYERDQRLKKKVKKNSYTDYPSILTSLTGANFYKVQSGPFKTFFVLGVNCCKLADNIIGKSGTDLLKMTGIITPGTYYEYLNQEFYKKNSMVISKVIYNNKSIKSKKKFFSTGSIAKKEEK